jgi:UDP:flavonoid glycosyltransferase YjiC (YdhE family)
MHDMARIGITTFGSTGDLNPFIALGLALRSNGHDVLFAVEANFEQRLSSLGFPVRVLKGDHAEALGPYSHQIFNSDQQLTSLKLLLDRYILPTLTAKLAELREICQEADLLISVASQFAASIVAEMLQIPWIAVILTPAMSASPEHREDVLQVSFAPFSQVFPACAAVIHHGGIGTIAQCLRAGVPSLVVPGGMDQPFNAAQVMERKAGLWIPRKRYTVRRAGQALKTLLFTPTYQEHARKIQAQVMQEDGVSILCTAVERVLRDFYGSPKRR